MARAAGKLQFSAAARKRIRERDHGKCIFCAMGYHMEYISGRFPGTDIMHFIPRSQMGLGMEQNGALGCREHHELLDNGNKGLRQEMLGHFEAYLRACYPGWDRDRLVYRKYDF
ncbi:MAG: hypothetical protein NC489_25500 [Ruminococcus flavefaciens]|nr:hypothetical protein [Ruminococcus flavefaciens]